MRAIIDTLPARRMPTLFWICCIAITTNAITPTMIPSRPLLRICISGCTVCRYRIWIGLSMQSALSVGNMNELDLSRE